jgi:trimeric autotransporter adhesin
VTGTLTAVGYQALKYSTGVNSTAMGYQALVLNTSGNANTAFGASCLINNTTGSSNTAIGEGCNSGNFSGSLLLGRDALATANNQAVFGSAGTNAGAVTTETITADTTWTVRINGANYKIPMLAI